MTHSQPVQLMIQFRNCGQMTATVGDKYNFMLTAFMYYETAVSNPTH